METVQPISDLSPKNDKKTSNKPVRSTNFSVSETLKLEELVKQNFEVLNSKLTNQVTNAKKNEIWMTISQEVSAIGHAYRSAKACSEKWANMRRKAKDELTNEKLQRRKTGGGTYTGASQQSLRISELIGSSAAFSGIEGGLDTDEPGNPLIIFMTI